MWIYNTKTLRLEEGHLGVKKANLYHDSTKKMKNEPSSVIRRDAEDSADW
jgi:hypothetical protein